MRVLVAYASKHGATTEIAEAIAQELTNRQLDVDLCEVDDVTSIDDRDAVILGSAVYMGNWLPAARKFVDRYKGALAAKPVWLFSSGPLGNPPKPEADKAVRIDPIQHQVNARAHQIFAGRLDKRRLSFGERAVVAAVHAPEGDYRDWGEIKTWAADLAQALR